MMGSLVTDVAGRFGIRPKEAKRFVKFMVVGTIGFIVDFGTLTTLVELFKVQTLIANTISFSAAVVSNFTWNRLWTYPDSRSKPLVAQLVQFITVSVAGLIINDTIVYLLEGVFNDLMHEAHLLEGRGYIPAKIVATVVVLFWNFFINRYWTYGDVA